MIGGVWRNVRSVLKSYSGRCRFMKICYNDEKDAKKDYKDRLFKFIFGNPENKQWTLSLYNAINGTDYTNPDDIQFNTIGDAVYMRMKNDISFIVAFEMDLWEHQSSFNPNMPMRARGTSKSK